MKTSNLIDPFRGKPGIYHFSTDALKKKILFKERTDFVYGVNSIAICAKDGKVDVLCYCLMSNHIHILLRGALSDCLRLMRKLMFRLAVYAGKRDREKAGFGVEDFEIVPVTSRNQMKKEIAYILRNPYKARVASPISYEWNSADVMFNPHAESVHGKSVQELTVVECRRTFATRGPLPEHYEYFEGKILNKCFVRNDLAQKCFRDDIDYFNEIKKFDNEIEVEGERLGKEHVFFTDEELHAKMLRMCRNEYYVSSPDQLDRKSLLNLARALRVRFGAGKEQLERLLGLDDSLVGKL
jgi:hypothetical protein